MKDRMRLSRGTSFAGRATGQSTEPLMKAVHAKAEYRKKGGKSSGKDEAVFVDDGHRRVVAGYIRGPKFSKRVTNQQILQKPPAICIQESLLGVLQQKGVSTVEVELIDSGRTLTAPLARIAQRGKSFDRGYGRQVMLMMEQWDDANDPQLALFGGAG